MDDPLSWLALAVGAGIGAVIGAVAQATNFCSVGAVGDIILAKDSRRMRSWLMAAAIALLGAQGLMAAGVVNLDATIYRIPRIDWLSITLGSVAFGYGMAQAGGCIQRALVRVGGGSVRSLVVLALVAVSALATIKFLLVDGWVSRLGGDIRSETPALDQAVSAALNADPLFVAVALAVIIAGCLLAFCVKDQWFRASPGHLWGGMAIGLAVVAAWAASGLRPPPVDGINLLFATVDTAAPFLHPFEYTGFGIGIVVGMIGGSFTVAAARGDLMLDRFVDKADLGRHIVGGVLMGFGGALAHGCSFGQGLSGFSTLSIAAFIAIAGMGLGCVWGIRALEAGSAWGGLRLCFGGTPR